VVTTSPPSVVLVPAPVPAGIDPDVVLDPSPEHAAATRVSDRATPRKRSRDLTGGA
jgi:hypothetical protein